MVPLKNVREVMVLLARCKVASSGALTASRNKDIRDARVPRLASGRSYEARY